MAVHAVSRHWDKINIVGDGTESEFIDTFCLALGSSIAALRLPILRCLGYRRESGGRDFGIKNYWGHI